MTPFVSHAMVGCNWCISIIIHVSTIHLQSQLPIMVQMMRHPNQSMSLPDAEV